MQVSMITIEDIIAFSGLSRDEVLAIAEHEHLPEVAACALAEYLMQQEHGAERVRAMIVEDIRAAQERGDKEHVKTLLHVLHHFVRSHRDALPLSGGQTDVT
ncbi:MAG: hypothetical protein KJZ80_15155 [Hyphomicrobiaceae bacterium]|nr:hypothetical protein [Hyphomicrobiaceae bacterium]